jgi:hypothetical protein
VRSVGELTAVLANLVPGRRRGGSCARPGVASRVVALTSCLIVVRTPIRGFG